MSGLAAFQGRVVAEKAELDDKLAKLTAFANTPVFAALDRAERERMVRQASAMKAYSNVLGERIEAFVIPSEFR